MSGLGGKNKTLIINTRPRRFGSYTGGWFRRLYILLRNRGPMGASKRRRALERPPPEGIGAMGSTARELPRVA